MSAAITPHKPTQPAASANVRFCWSQDPDVDGPSSGSGSGSGVGSGLAASSAMVGPVPRSAPLGKRYIADTVAEPLVVLEPIARDQAFVLANLFELYVHDFSEQVPIDLQPNGRFDRPIDE